MNTATKRPVSEAQTIKLNELLAEKLVTAVQDQFLTAMVADMTTSKEASAVITFLCALPNKPGIVPKVRERKPLFDPAEPGEYLLGEQRYLVRFSKKGQWYANELDRDDTGTTVIGKYLGKQVDLTEARLLFKMEV